MGLINQVNLVIIYLQTKEIEKRIKKIYNYSDLIVTVVVITRVLLIVKLVVKRHVKRP
jgi:putative effector of murein hydrolase